MREPAKLGGMAVREMLGPWHSVTSAYNAAKLTYESDRPHALKGVIKTLEQETGVKFVVGVCEGLLNRKHD
jgi:hypothetical protein